MVSCVPSGLVAMPAAGWLAGYVRIAASDSKVHDHIAQVFVGEFGIWTAKSAARSGAGPACAGGLVAVRDEQGEKVSPMRDTRIAPPLLHHLPQTIHQPLHKPLRKALIPVNAQRQRPCLFGETVTAEGTVAREAPCMRTC